jgi:hypothetical protein
MLQFPKVFVANNLSAAYNVARHMQGHVWLIDEAK